MVVVNGTSDFTEPCVGRTQILPLAFSFRTMPSSSTRDVKGVPDVADEGQERRTPTTIEELSASVDQRFDAVDRRFDGVDRRLDAVDRRLDAIDRRFEGVDRRFEGIDRRFEAVDAAFVEQRQYTEFAFGKLEQELVVVKSGLGRVERKLDRLIDAAFPSEKPQSE